MTRPTARRAEAADVPVLVDLMDEFYAEASFTLDRVWAANAFAELVAEPRHGAVWVMECDGAAVGHVVLSVRFTMEFGGPSAYIDDLFVRRAHRRLGAARAGLEALLEESRQRGCRSVQVEVGENNEAAQALYRGYGLQAPSDDRQMLRMPLT